jgi:hypothetical protein
MKCEKHTEVELYLGRCAVCEMEDFDPNFVGDSPELRRAIQALKNAKPKKPQRYPPPVVRFFK